MEHYETADYAKAISASILRLRKEKGLTQEALADQLGLSFQAVSKWENQQSTPDITLLPRLAELFGATVDELFGIRREQAARPEEQKQQEPAEPTYYVEQVPWDDDDAIRGVVYRGKTLLKHYGLFGRQPEFTFRYEGAAVNVLSHGHLICGYVQGNAKAGTQLQCSRVDGSAQAGTSLECGDIGESADAGTHIQCSGSIGGDAKAGTHIHCTEIGGNAKAGTGIHQMK